MDSRTNTMLASPFSVGSLTTRNRIAMAPMTRYKSPGGIPGPDVAEYYARRARADVGLIITEGVFVPHQAAGYSTVIPTFDTVEAREGWRAVVERVHEAGSAIVSQLWHTGISRPGGTGPFPDAPVVSPSGITQDGAREFGPMSATDIDDVIGAFASAASTAHVLGFDAVEIHGAHGYLIDQFLWSRTNARTDHFGGGIASRSAFAADIVRAIRAVVPSDFPVLFRMSQWKTGHYDRHLAQTPRELEQILHPLLAAGVDVFHGSQRRYWLPEFDDSTLNLAGWIKKITGVPTITVGSVGLDGELIGPQGPALTTQATGLGDLETRLEDHEFDLVAVGRALISDPNWATKALAGRSMEAIPYARSFLFEEELDSGGQHDPASAEASFYPGGPEIRGE